MQFRLRSSSPCGQVLRYVTSTHFFFQCRFRIFEYISFVLFRHTLNASEGTLRRAQNDKPIRQNTSSTLSFFKLPRIFFLFFFSRSFPRRMEGEGGRSSTRTSQICSPHFSFFGVFSRRAFPRLKTSKIRREGKKKKKKKRLAG